MDGGSKQSIEDGNGDILGRGFKMGLFRCLSQNRPTFV